MSSSGVTYFLRKGRISLREINGNTIYHYFMGKELRVVADMSTAVDDNPLSADMYFVGTDIARIMGCSSRPRDKVMQHQKYSHFIPENGYLDVECKNGTIRPMRTMDFKAAISLVCSDPQSCLPIEQKMALIEELCVLAKKYNI
jgi:hypothetical protein